MKFKPILDAYFWLLQAIMTMLMVLMLLPVSVQVLSRYTGLVPRYIWTEEVARFCFVWVIMVGSMIAVRQGTHFDVDLMPAPKTQRERGFSRLTVHALMMLMAVVFASYGIQFARFGAMQFSEMSGINMASIYVSFPLAGWTWTVFLLERMAEDIRLIRSDLPAQSSDS